MFIGIDTSNYTTSIASYNGKNVINSRRILPVKEGQRGLRQSDALFQHIKQFNELFDAIMEQVDEIEAVGVSVRPRNCDGSYMPVFLAGEAFAKTLASGLKVPCYEFSHQDGHIMSALYSLGINDLSDGKFLSVHISGGTTEILITEYNGHGFDVEIVGGTKDISAGQFIDRAGVKAGMKFPCGKELDELSMQANSVMKFPICEKNGYINFSGVETMVQRLDCITADVALGIFDNVARALTRAINYCVESTRCQKVVIVGGVASNSYISEYFKKHIKGQVLLSDPQYATDNAAGIAVLCERIYSK